MMSRFMEGYKEFIDTALRVNRLKTVDRAGWRRQGIHPCESVASHVFGTEHFVFNLPKEIEGNRYTIMLLMHVHDYAECDPGVGDITPHDGVTSQEKSARERKAMEKLTAGMSNGPELMALWQEYEDGITPEAIIAREVDKLETAFQGLVDERQTGTDLPEFFNYTEERIRHPAFLEMMKEIRGRRPVITQHDWVI